MRRASGRNHNLRSRPSARHGIQTGSLALPVNVEWMVLPATTTIDAPGRRTLPFEFAAALAVSIVACLVFPVGEFLARAIPPVLGIAILGGLGLLALDSPAGAALHAWPFSAGILGLAAIYAVVRRMQAWTRGAISPDDVPGYLLAFAAVLLGNAMLDTLGSVAIAMASMGVDDEACLQTALVLVAIGASYVAWTLRAGCLRSRASKHPGGSTTADA